ncbi:MAG: hypothetical protein AB7U63_15285 [Porticoccaceae bacterium]
MNCKFVTTVLATVVSLSSFAGDETCFPQQIGLHVEDSKGVRSYIAVAKSEPLTPDVDSYLSAYDEATGEAKRMLAEASDSTAKTVQLSGVVFERCQTNDMVYVRAVLEPKNSDRADTLGRQISDSISNIPPPPNTLKIEDVGNWG